ncbi:MAG: DUF4394 domain-containing protein, partial [Thermosynechococcaceae cyanobacterium]
MKVSSKSSAQRLLIATVAAVVSWTGFTLNLGPGRNAVSQAATVLPKVSFIGLSPNNNIVQFGLRGTGKKTKISNISGNLIGLDYRPANGKLYGVTDTNKIYIINPALGTAKLVKTLSTNFSGGFQSGLDFNPQLDRLRINSLRQNFSVNVDDGTATAQTPLAYAA